MTRLDCLGPRVSICSMFTCHRVLRGGEHLQESGRVQSGVKIPVMLSSVFSSTMQLQYKCMYVHTASAYRLQWWIWISAAACRKKKTAVAVHAWALDAVGRWLACASAQTRGKYTRNGAGDSLPY